MRTQYHDTRYVLDHNTMYLYSKDNTHYTLNHHLNLRARSMSQRDIIDLAALFPISIHTINLLLPHQHLSPSSLLVLLRDRPDPFPLPIPNHDHPTSIAHSRWRHGTYGSKAY